MCLRANVSSWPPVLKLSTVSAPLLALVVLCDSAVVLHLHSLALALSALVEIHLLNSPGFSPSHIVISVIQI